jgi:hypothetical protein
MLKTLFFRAFTMLMLLVLAATMYAHQTYTLKLGRGLKEFDQYLLKSSYEQRSTTKIYNNDVLLGDTTDVVRIIIAAQCSVSRVTVDGQEKEKNLVIRLFQMQTNTDTFDILPTGTKVRCWFSDSGSAYTIDGVPVADSAATYLSNVVLGEGGAKTGDVLDAKKPVAVGSTWNMNIAALKRVLGREQVKLMKKLNGTVRFASIDSTSPMPTAIITARAEAPKFTMKVDGASFPLVGSLVAEFRYVVPVDVRFPPTALTTSTTQTYTASQGTQRAESFVTTRRTSEFIR